MVVNFSPTEKTEAQTARDPAFKPKKMGTEPGPGPGHKTRGADRICLSFWAGKQCREKNWLPVNIWRGGKIDDREMGVMKRELRPSSEKPTSPPENRGAGEKCPELPQPPAFC